jgi:cobyrinic acid a,c-diamide synthase
VTLGTLAALIRRGLKVAPYKVGPDFIDPGHHARVAGTVSKNLDGWMLSKDANLACFYREAANADVAVVEGVMGLFDGYDGKTEAGSTAQMAKWLGLPVVLLVDAASMARSAAAVVMGFEHFDRQLNYAGVIFNNLGSQRHLQYLQDALRDRVKMPCLGGIMRRSELVMPERHLGLVTSEDQPLTAATIGRMADLVEAGIDLDRLLNTLPDTAPPPPKAPARSSAKKRVRIALARDNAFCFYYAANLELLEKNGAQIVTFSPIKDADLPADIDGLYLGGGYPELYAENLSRNQALRDRIKTESRHGMPIYAECGGFMYLCEELHDTHDRRHPMVGCFPLAAKMFPRLKALGYREITLTRDTIIGGSGLTVRGHEFHYSQLAESSPRKIQTAYRIADRAGMDKAPEGYLINRTLGSYTHLHFGSQPPVAGHFVDNCRMYRHERETINET